MREKILIVDDDRDLAAMLSLHLKEARFEVVATHDGTSALQAARAARPDLIILDLRLPDFSGMEVFRSLRGRRTTAGIPVLMLTARGDEADKVAAFELGADDYVTKPFNPREVVLRVRAVLNRSKGPAHTDTVKSGGVALDDAAQKLLVRGRAVNLTRTEFALLSFLIHHAGSVQSRQRLLDEVWGVEADIITRTVDVTVDRVRRKIGSEGRRLRTVRGVGYCWEGGDTRGSRKTGRRRSMA